MRQERCLPATRIDSESGIDMAQWRSDIQTFVDETNRELEQIIDHLQAQPPKSTQSHIAKSASESQFRTLTNPGDESPPSGPASPTDARLAQLKQQLADRLKQTRQPSS